MSAARSFTVVPLRRRPPAARRRPDEELEILRRVVTLKFRGKELVNAKGIAAFCEEADCVPGLTESVDRLLAFFDRESNGSWIEETTVFRLANVDLASHLKRLWREFEHRRTTLRQYLDASGVNDDEGPSLLFKLPETSLDSVESFDAALRGFVGALDRICRAALEDGFSVVGFRGQSAWLGVRAESETTLALAKQVFKIFHWYQKQCADVRRLEAHASISPEYVKAAKSLRAAQARHLVVLIDKSLEDTVGHLEKAVWEETRMKVKGYIEALGAHLDAGAEIAIPATLDDEERASWPSIIQGSLSD